MSYTDAPIPNGPDAQFSAWRLQQEERTKRLENSQQFYPIHVQWRPGNSNATIIRYDMASTSYASGYRVYVPWTYYDTIVVQFAVSGSGGNVVSRVTELTTGFSTSELVTSPAQVTLTWHWLHGIDTYPYPPIERIFSFETRIQTGGGGLAASIFYPHYCYFAPSSMIEQAASNGGVVVS